MARKMVTNEVILEKINYLTERVDEVHKSIEGNGRPGLKERVMSLETKWKVIGGIASSSAVSSIILLIIQLI